LGTGEGSDEGGVDWFWNIVPDKTGYVAFDISVPFSGFYMVSADDGSWDSKQASISLDLYIQAFQYNDGGLIATNLLVRDSQNIDENARCDLVYKAYYSALLVAGDMAQLYVSIRLSALARGDGSYAELNFDTGTANRLDAPWLTMR
jgi:hypothetical protein